MGNTKKNKVRLVFVCLGNICRSPTAEGVMRSLVERERLEDRVEVDSAGTSAWHVGERPDPRSRAAAASRNIRVDGSARHFDAADFERFDLVLALDSRNHADLSSLAADPAAREKLHLLRDFDPKSAPGSDVPDPYFGGAGGFEEVIDLCEAACEGVLAHLQTTGRI